MTAKIRVIDIGGGLPVDYKHDEPNHIALTYAKALRAEVPAFRGVHGADGDGSLHCGDERLVCESH